jgi:AmmeMemoRadiSam system protein B
MERQSRHAGSWYEGAKSSLERQLHDLFIDPKWGYGLDPVKTPLERSPDPNLLGIVSPHAGYVYSGSIASHGFGTVYKHVEKVDTVIILGPNHQGMGAPISFYPEGKWSNPLGSVEIDEEFIEYAKNYDFGSLQSHVGFESNAHSYEHSIDIQLPFLQYLYEDQFSFIPICLGEQSYTSTVPNLSTFLSKYIQSHPDKRVLIVASSDLSHEHNYDLVVKNDTTLISHLEKMELDEAENFRRRVNMTMCGYGPVFTLLHTAKLLGKPEVNILKYANSSDIRPGGSYTVGYASIVVRYS